MRNERLEAHLAKLIHELADINQEIFSSGEYNDFLSLCNNDISILASLEDYPGETAKQVSVRLSLPKTTVVTAVSRLVKRGYINREQNSQDGREQLLLLTDLGKKVNKEHEKYEKYFLESLMNLFQEEDYETLADIFERSRVCSTSKLSGKDRFGL
ncbi:MAG: MarR family winged helix-turn-helix transcriptional regulator [Bacteroides sp.]